MKHVLYSVALLLPFLSSANTEVSQNTAYKYVGPFYFDAQKSNAGILEMPLAYNSSVSIVLGNDDTIAETINSCSTHQLDRRTISKDKKTVVYDTHIKEENKICSVNILTTNGLTHTFSFIAAPEDFKTSDVALKVVIK